MGTKSLYLAFGQAFASQGIMVAIADYRLYPQVRYPAFIEDSASAFAYVRDHAGVMAGHRTAFIAGHSAGAYNAMMLAADRSISKMRGGDLRDLRRDRHCRDHDFLPLTIPI